MRVEDRAAQEQLTQVRHLTNDKDIFLFICPNDFYDMKASCPIFLQNSPLLVKYTQTHSSTFMLIHSTE